MHSVRFSENTSESAALKKTALEGACRPMQIYKGVMLGGWSTRYVQYVLYRTLLATCSAPWIALNQ